MKFEATALLLNYSKDSSLVKAITSIRKQSIPIEIILVDNSPDGGNFDCDLYIRPGRNLHCKARFLAGCYAKSDYLFTLDDDVILDSPDAIKNYLDFLKEFEYRGECVCGWDHYDKRQRFFNGWASVNFLKGRFMLFHKEYLEKVSIGFPDLIDPESGAEKTGYSEEFVKWIGVDDLAFQLNAEYVLIPDLENPPILDQKTASNGLFKKKKHFKIRQEYREKHKNKIVRKSTRKEAIVETVLILTHKDSRTGLPLLPHLDWLKKTNPNVRVEIIVGEDSPFGKSYNWKNGDQPLRKWWKENRGKVEGETIAVIEWDTLVGCPLPALSKDLDLAGKRLFTENFRNRKNWRRKKMKDPTWHADNWWWWSEIPLLELRKNERAKGLISFGAFFMRRWVLDAMCNERWDRIYDKSIQNELRFPSVAAAEGAEIGEIPLPFVEWDDVEVGEIPGIYHGVNQEFVGNFGPDRESLFTEIYESAQWGDNGETSYRGSSGCGSSVGYNKKYIEFLKDFIGKSGVKSVLDLGCGDFRCGPSIYENFELSYTGIDVYGDLVNHLRVTQNEKYNFRKMDFCANQESLPFADLCILKDVLQHLSNDTIVSLLDSLRKKCKYILISNSFNGTTEDCEDGTWHYLSSELHPLNRYGFRPVLYFKQKEVSLWESPSNEIAAHVHVSGTVEDSLVCTLGSHFNLTSFPQASASQFDFRDCYSFAFVRNPLDRICSAYFHILNGEKQDGKLRKRLEQLKVSEDAVENFRIFISCLSQEKELQKCERFMPISHSLDKTLSFVGRYESLQRDLDLVCRDLGVEKLSLSQTDHSKKKRDLRIYYNSETEALVRKIYKRDFQIFGY